MALSQTGNQSQGHKAAYNVWKGMSEEALSGIKIMY
jgi:hypothetical protein